jgi:hypothetical protein
MVYPIVLYVLLCRIKKDLSDWEPIDEPTAPALMDNKGRVYGAGMDDIVIIPFNANELYNMLTKHLY